jgi:hypothetical protein
MSHNYMGWWMGPWGIFPNLKRGHPFAPCDDFGFGTTWSNGKSKWKCPISYWLSYMITLWMLKACKTGSSSGGSWRFCTLHEPSFATRDEFGPVQSCHKTRGPQLPNRNKWMSLKGPRFQFTYTRVDLWANNNRLNLRCSWERLEEQLGELDGNTLGTRKKILFSKTVC